MISSTLSSFRMQSYRLPQPKFRSHDDVEPVHTEAELAEGRSEFLRLNVGALRTIVTLRIEEGKLERETAALALDALENIENTGRMTDQDQLALETLYEAIKPEDES